MWHSVIVRIDVHGARLLAKVDNESAEINLQGLHVSSNYGIATDLNSVVLIGGKYLLDSRENLLIYSGICSKNLELAKITPKNIEV